MYAVLGLFAAAGFWYFSNGGQQSVEITKNRVSVIAFLSPSSKPDLWLMELPEGNPEAITDTDGKVYDFDVAPNGNFIIFSMFNQSGGKDLMRINLRGKRMIRLADCGVNDCLEPAISPDGKLVAFTRMPKNVEGQLILRPMVWVLNLATQVQQPLFEDQTKSGAQPDWSPQGDRLAIVDEFEKVIRVVNLSTGDSTAIPTELGQMGVFSPDGTRMLFINTQINGIQSFQGVFTADFNEQQIKPFLAPEFTEIDYSVPAWSPDGKKIAVSWRRLIGLGRGSEQLSLFQADGSGEKLITNQFNLTHAAYSWSPDNNHLLFQQFEIGNTAAKPQIAIWTEETTTKHVVAEDAFLPQWVP